ncbi:MAG: GNAT family N-acetyltransferase, partial [Lysobacteraceae bacterium]
DSTAERLEIGILLLATARGTGFAKEAKTALAQRLFECLPVAEIWVEYEAGNTAAKRSFTSLGFKQCTGQIAGSGNSNKRIMSVQRTTWCKPGSDADHPRSQDV